ncbi:MAG TPA: hypothetical protein VK571_02820 [Gemmatimonadaceae bacterium]|jgi:hypothetical protein|nr:hypothetical protein [Gemmatimonadaceae bacterium]
MNNRSKADSIAAARREIARRVARFCTSLPPEEYERLLDRMALIQWKYDIFPHADDSLRLGELVSGLAESSTAQTQDTLS